MIRDVNTLVERVHCEPVVKPLTDRQVEVLCLIAQDCGRKQIAAKLGISIKTTDYHVGVLKAKTGAHTQVGLTIYALQNGFVRIAGITTAFNNANDTHRT